MILVAGRGFQQGKEDSCRLQQAALLLKPPSWLSLVHQRKLTLHGLVSWIQTSLSQPRLPWVSTSLLTLCGPPGHHKWNILLTGEAATIPSYPAYSFPQLLLSLSVSLGDEQVLLT